MFNQNNNAMRGAYSSYGDKIILPSLVDVVEFMRGNGIEIRFGCLRFWISLPIVQMKAMQESISSYIWCAIYLVWPVMCLVIELY